MIWRYPDKPGIAGVSMLDDIDAGEWCCQNKLDGWRVVVAKEKGELRAYTRHNMRLGRAMHRDDDFEPGLAKLLNVVVVEGSMLDGEFMSTRRPTPLPNEGFMAFDVLYFMGQWMGDSPYRDRMKLLHQIFLLASDIMHAGDFGHVEGHVGMCVPITTGAFIDFYESQRGMPGTEGVVLKRCDSKLIGHPNHSAVNPEWIKVLHKEGAQ